MSFTVKAQQGGTTANGMVMDVAVLTGQAASPIGSSIGVVSTTPAATLSSPAGTGSMVFQATLSLGSGTFTPNGSTTTMDDRLGAGLHFTNARLTGLTTAGTAVTVGGTNTSGNAITTCAVEIRAGTGLAIDASSAGPTYNGSGPNVTSPAFTPPAGSLILAMIESNGAAGSITISMSDTSGLGLVWTEIVKQAPAGSGYTGFWYAIMPGGGGTAHTVGASLTITPTFNAGRIRGHARGASLTITPAFSATGTVGSGGIHHTVGASLAVTPTFNAGRIRGHTRSAALSPVPVLNAGRTRGHTRAASLSVTPVLHAAGFASGGNVLTLSVTSDINVLSGLTLTATIKVNVGAPLQEGIRSLATDRWYSMYPS